MRRATASVLVSNVVYEVSRVSGGMLLAAMTLVSSLIACLLVVASIVVFAPLAAIIGAGLLGGCFLALHLATRQRLARSGATVTSLWADRSRVLSESFAAIREVLLGGSQRHFVEAVRAQSSHHCRRHDARPGDRAGAAFCVRDRGPPTALVLIRRCRCGARGPPAYRSPSSVFPRASDLSARAHTGAGFRVRRQAAHR